MKDNNASNHLSPTDGKNNEIAWKHSIKHTLGSVVKHVSFCTYRMVSHSFVLYFVVLCHIIPYHAILYCTLPCRIISQSTILYHMTPTTSSSHLSFTSFTACTSFPHGSCHASLHSSLPVCLSLAYLPACHPSIWLECLNFVEFFFVELLNSYIYSKVWEPSVLIIFTL